MKNIVLLAAALFILIRASAAQAAPTVSWLPDGQPFDVGFEPTVALANPSSGVQIVSVHQGSTGSNSPLWWDKGTSVGQKLVDQNELTSQSSYRPSITWTNDFYNMFVEVSSDVNDNLYYSTRTNGGAWTTPQFYGVGVNPSIAFDGVATFVEVHTEYGTPSASVHYLTGYLNYLIGPGIQWNYPNGNEGTFLDYGDMASVAMAGACSTPLNNCGGVDIWDWVLVVDQEAGGLYYRSGCMDASESYTIGCGFSNSPTAVPTASPAGQQTEPSLAAVPVNATGALYAVAVLAYTDSVNEYSQTITLNSVPTKITSKLTLGTWTTPFHYDYGSYPSIALGQSGNPIPGIEVHYGGTVQSELWQHGFNVSY